MEIVMKVIGLVVKNWEMITAVVIPGLMLLVGLIRANNKVKFLREKFGEAKIIGDALMDWIDYDVSQLDPEQAKQKVAAMKRAQQVIGIQKKVDSALTSRRVDRREDAKSGKIGLDIDVDLDKDGNFRPGIGINFEKIF